MSVKERIAMYDAMHEHCLAKMKKAIEVNNKSKFWALAGVDIRILTAKLNSSFQGGDINAIA